MSHLRTAVLTSFLSMLAVAQAAAGGVLVYLQPLPPDASKLTFSIATVSAVGADGTQHRLEVAASKIGPEGASRQRLLAAGSLPTGSYTGFSLTIGAATLRTPQGDVKLPVPDGPTTVALPFSVSGQEPPLVWLTFHYQDPSSTGFGFASSFSGVMPSRPLTGRAAFVSNTASDTITVIDKQLAQAVAAIATCAGPSGMALDQQRRRLYVACARDDEIQAIDVASAAVVERSRLSPGDTPTELALTPDGRTLVSVNSGSNSISVLDAEPLTRQDRIGVDTGPCSISIDPAGRRAFVFSARASSISVVDLGRREPIAKIQMESAPFRGQFSARGDRLIVAHERSPYLSVVDPQQLAIVTRARLGSAAGAIRLDSRRQLLYLGGRDDTRIEFYDPTTLLPIDAMRIGGDAAYMTVDTEADRLYVVSPKRRSVLVGNLADRRTIAEIDVGEGPYWVSVMGEK